MAPLRAWFDELAGDAAQRAAVVRHTLDGALGSLRPRIAALAAQADAQVDAAQRLREQAGDAYAGALASGRRGHARRHPAARRGARPLAGVRRHRRADAHPAGPGRPLAGPARRGAVTGTRRPARSWPSPWSPGWCCWWTAPPSGPPRTRPRPGGPTPPAPSCCAGPAARWPARSPGFRAAVERTVRDWQAGVLELVRREGGSRRSTARAAAYGVNATGLLVMIAIFATTNVIAAPLEVAVAGGIPVLSQKVLEAIFGDQAVRRLAATARADLLERVAKLLDDERERYDALLATQAPDPAAAALLERAVAAVERAR